MNSCVIIVACALAGPCFASDLQADTAQLAAHLKRVRPYAEYQLQPQDYNTLQDEYVAWIDARVKAGRTPEQMDAELESAGLMSKGQQDVDDYWKNYAGFVGGVQTISARPANDVFALDAGIYTGSSCGHDDTVLVYRRAPLRQLARVNAEKSFTHGFLLRELAVGDGSNGWIIGSGWVASNCTSNWNGEILRIDRLTSRGLENLLDRGVGAYSGVDMKISIGREAVVFRYETGTGNLAILTRPAIARFGISTGKAVREAPIADSFGGFISEWLDLNDSDAARWSTRQAAARHHDLASRARGGLFAWKAVADCPGPSPARAITVEWDQSKAATTFLIAGSTRAQMRMVSIVQRAPDSCRAFDISKSLKGITGEPVH